METMWANPISQRSLIQSNSINAEIVDYAKLSITSFDGGNSKTVSIFPNMEYTVSFYDTNYGTLRTVTGLVLNIWAEQIKIKIAGNASNTDDTSNDNLQCSCCSKRNACTKYKHSKSNSNVNTVESPMPTCNCVLNPPDMSKYSDPEIVYIPFANIVNVEYVKNSGCSCNGTLDNNEGRVDVMILGISATMLKAIVIRLEFFDDSIEEAVKYVDLEVGGVYNFAYECKNKDRTVYETTAKLISIEEVPENMCQTGKGFVREHVGMNNTVYTSCCCTSKDEFMTAPPVKRIKLVVDTSETFSGCYESIMLDAIRDCTLVQAADGNIPEDDEQTDKNCDCCCCNKKHPDDEPSTKIYNLSNGYVCHVTGNKVEIFDKDCNRVDLTMEELLSFYIGV